MKIKWISKENVHLWPNCATPDCEYKACTVLDSTHCFPCTMRLRKMDPEEGRKLIKSIREKAFGVGCDG
jgi:hypothetical protein